MINMNVLAARIVEESMKLDPVLKLADELFMAGLREEDINWRILANKVPIGSSIPFRNRIRDLERGFRKPGERA